MTLPPPLLSRATGINPNLVKYQGGTFQIDRSVAEARFSPAVIKKVIGEPDGNRRVAQSDERRQMEAAREAYAAIKLAKQTDDGTNVYLGKGKTEFLKSSGRTSERGLSNCDAIAAKGNLIVGLGEGKGEDVLKAVRQLSATASRVASPHITSLVIIASPPLSYLAPTYESDPKGKTVQRWGLVTNSKDSTYFDAVARANALPLNPSYYYFLSEEGGAHEMNNLGLAYGILSKAPDQYLRTHRRFLKLGRDEIAIFDKAWNKSGPFKLTLPDTNATGIWLELVIPDSTIITGDPSDEDYDEEEDRLHRKSR